MHGAGLEISGDFHEGLVYIDEIGECCRIARMPVRVVTVRLLLKGDPDFTRTAGIISDRTLQSYLILEEGEIPRIL